MTRNPRGSSGEYHDPNNDTSDQLSRRAAVGAIAAAVGGGTVLVATTGDDFGMSETTVRKWDKSVGV